MPSPEEVIFVALETPQMVLDKAMVLRDVLFTGYFIPRRGLHSVLRSLDMNGGQRSDQEACG